LVYGIDLDDEISGSGVSQKAYSRIDGEVGLT
jgi:hypothetical protein